MTDPRPGTYHFPGITRFRDREAELRAMTSWWEDDDDDRALMLHGRRRVGKSWLFRAFAHRREADIFVADTRALTDQLAGFAAGLERDGERPVLPDLEAFFRTLFRRARESRRLVVIDELPLLWKVERDLPSILMRVMEEEAGASRLKLLLAGSHVGMMERLLAEREPLHGRLRPLRMRPFDLAGTRAILGPVEPEQLLVAHGLSGGMPRYLTELVGAPDPARRMAELALDPLGPLFDEPRAILAQELDVPHVYFSLLAALAKGPLPWGDLVAHAHVPTERAGRYIATLAELGLVAAHSPITDRAGLTRTRRYSLTDGFMRFWFRFVLPYQADLESGLDHARLFDEVVVPSLSDHLAPAVEDVARAWVRARGLGAATHVGAWWGPSLHELRRTGERTSEEIDICGLRGRRVVLIGEVRWRAEPMDMTILDDLLRYKLPALGQVSGVSVAAAPITVLVSRAGFTTGLQERAAHDLSIILVTLETLVA